ncbi:LANO_0G13498g1_1 [Lachancea nothofagi CBS 11611]|uniref:LANO_0G13498g1_1 n=1 Tax=Lachancea nothofagi CBS 11611 TaxID=1266666 RepID=A0A1G4KKB2_9SACH|nr:LANO_0G13498g1_1 [Lachancea nothofagi CBS 11611]
MLRKRATYEKAIVFPNDNEILDEDDNGARTRFTWLDVLRIVGGLVLLGLIAGKFMTDSVTWNYWSRSRSLETLRQIPKFWDGQTLPLEFSLEQLHTFDGSNPETPVLLAIEGHVFDVSRKSGLYGPRGAYHRFAGTDCSRAFSYRLWSMQGLREPCSSDLSGLSPEGLHRVDEWLEFFQHRYPYIGYVKST